MRSFQSYEVTEDDLAPWLDKKFDRWECRIKGASNED